ncbi:hypothetical protein LXL04_007917 [Taraxacum kok-saghyz]
MLQAFPDALFHHLILAMSHPDHETRVVAHRECAYASYVESVEVEKKHLMDAMFIRDPCPRLYGQAFEEFHSRIFGSAPVKSMAETRRKARLIGQDSPGGITEPIKSGIRDSKAGEVRTCLLLGCGMYFPKVEMSTGILVISGCFDLLKGVDGEITEPMIKELDEDREESQDPEAIEPAEGILLIVESRDNINITQNALTVSNQQRNTEMVARILPYLTYGELAAMEALVQHFDEGRIQSFAFETFLRSFDSFDAERALRWDTWRLKSVSILPLLHALERVAGDNEIGARAENLLDTISDKEGKGDRFLALLFPNEVYCTIQIRDQEASGLRGTNIKKYAKIWCVAGMWELLQDVTGLTKAAREYNQSIIDPNTTATTTSTFYIIGTSTPVQTSAPVQTSIQTHSFLQTSSSRKHNLSTLKHRPSLEKSSSQSTNALAAATLLSSTVATSARDSPPMTVTYRLEGLDGEGTEPMIKELDEDRACLILKQNMKFKGAFLLTVYQDPVVEFALAWAVLECGGLEIVQVCVILLSKHLLGILHNRSLSTFKKNEMVPVFLKITKNGLFLIIFLKKMVLVFHKITEIVLVFYIATDMIPV